MTFSLYAMIVSPCPKFLFPGRRSMGSPLHRVQMARDAALEVPVDVHFFEFLDAVQEPVAQAPDALVVAGHLELRQARRLAEAHDLVRGKRARAHAALVAAAVDLRLDAHPGLAPDVERADPLWTVHLVCGYGEQVHLDLLDVDLQLARRLHRVAMENDALR